ncbi:MAG: hypothetical protein IPI58_04380 [Alphaproteobacteria bacterium]|nr:MAG: hypothetical protein IPI58_04380 [Alphaproteobacteria bacterium]
MTHHSSRCGAISDVARLAAVAAIILAALPDPAWAQILGESVKKVNEGIAGLPVVVSGLIYITGALFILSGGLLLKKYGDNPNGTPLSAGLGRLGVGSFLVAVQPTIGWIQTTLATTGATPQGVGKILPGFGA